MDTNNEILSFNIDEVENNDMDSMVDPIGSDDEVQLIEDSSLESDDASDAFVINIDSDESYDYIIADVNDEGIVDADNMFGVNEEDEAIDDDGDVVIIELKDISEDEDNIDESLASLNEDDGNLVNPESIIEDPEPEEVGNELEPEIEEYDNPEDLDTGIDEIDMSLF